MPYVEKLKTIRDDKKLTNVEISKLSNIPLATITRVFNGTTPNPTFETISKISIALGVSLDEITGLKPPEETPIASPIENTLNSYSTLLVEKDDRIKELKEELKKERKEKNRILGVLLGAFVLVSAILAILAIDLLNGKFNS